MTFVSQKDTNCDNEQKLALLSMALQGPASEFYEKSNSRHLFPKLENALFFLDKRYGEEESEHTAMLQLRNCKQKEGETYAEFEDRISSLAYTAHPPYQTELIEREIVFAFNYGLKDQKAAKHLTLSKCKTMNEVREELKIFEFAKNMSGRRTPLNVRAATGSQDEIESYESDDMPEGPRAIRQAKNENFKHAKNSKAEERIEQGVRETNAKLDEVIKGLNNLTSALNRLHPGRSRSRSSSQGTRRPLKCHHCQKEGHWISNCPEYRALVANQKDAKVDPKAGELTSPGMGQLQQR